MLFSYTLSLTSIFFSLASPFPLDIFLVIHTFLYQLLIFFYLPYKHFLFFLPNFRLFIYLFRDVLSFSFSFASLFQLLHVLILSFSTYSCSNPSFFPFHFFLFYLPIWRHLFFPPFHLFRLFYSFTCILSYSSLLFTFSQPFIFSRPDYTRF